MLTAERAPRTAFLTVADLAGWRIKTYGIAADRPRGELVAAAKRRAATVLPERPDLDGAFGVGFLIVHDTPGCCVASINWWMRPDELHQRAFIAPPDEPRLLAPLTSATIGRTPELAVIAHEHLAWLAHVLNRPALPDLEAYLGAALLS
jgi:hypothetical protein